MIALKRSLPTHKKLHILPFTTQSKLNRGIPERERERDIVRERGNSQVCFGPDFELFGVNVARFVN